MKAVTQVIAGLALASTLSVVAGPTPAATAGSPASSPAQSTAHSTARGSARGHAVFYGLKWFNRTVNSTASAHRYLHGAGPGFQHYAAREGAKLRRAAIRAGASPTCVRRTGIQVQRYHTRGFAYGAIGGCGGAVALWKRIGGHWRPITITQDVIYCSRLTRFAVPASVVRNGYGPATCYSRAQDDVVRYHHR